jgi:hypothetical protein
MVSYSPNGIDPDSGYQALSETAERVFCRGWSPAHEITQPIATARNNGDVHVMSAGIRYAEYNLADARCGLLRANLPAGPVTCCDDQHWGLVRRWR